MIKKDGYSTLQFLVSLIIICIFYGVIGLYLKSFSSRIYKEKQSLNEEKEINKLFNTIISDIKNDNTPDSNSRHDLFAKWNDKSINNLNVKIDNLSGKININSFPKDILEKTDLKKLFIDSSASIYQIYESQVLFSDFTQLSQYITLENYEKYFTTFGWFNYNSSDDTRFELLLNQLKINSITLLDRRKELLSTKQYIQSYTQLKMNTGTQFTEVFPYINLEAPINVNYIDQEVLKNILSYPSFNIKGAVSKAQTIASLRENQEITQEMLSNILELKKNNPLYYFLGTKTYFYKIRIEGKSKQCDFYIAREITDIDSYKNTPKYYLIKKSWI